MAALLRVVLCVLALSTAALAVDPSTFNATVSGTLVNGAYNSYFSAQPIAFTTPNGLVGSISGIVVSGLAANTSVCFSSVPVFGTNLNVVCPPGGYVVFTNTTVAAEVRFARKSFSAFSSTKRSNRFATGALEVVNQILTLQPGTDYYVSYSSLPAQVNSTLVLALTGFTCPEGFTSNGGAPATCFKPAPLVVGQPIQVDAAPGFVYYAVNPADYNETVGSVTFTLSAPPPPATAALVVADDAAPAGLGLFAQLNTLPTATAFAPVIGTGSSITVENPSTLTGTLYLGVQNLNTANTAAVLAASTTVCAANTYGTSCQTPTLYSATVPSGSQKFNKVGGSNPLAVYQIDATTVPANAEIVRVSVSSATQLTANGILARWGAPPTVTQYDYSIARINNNYVNQLVLPVVNAGVVVGNSFNNTWYVAVSATEDYVFWAGQNCADDCNGWNTTSTNGQCRCNGQVCDINTSYQVPQYSDSFGVCECKNTKKQNNYNCMALVESSSPFKTVYIVLIAVGGAIVLAVAIGVPVYCYLQNRKRDYERL